MNTSTALVLLLLAALCFLAVRRIKRKKLLSTCGGDCSACGGCCPHKTNP